MIKKLLCFFKHDWVYNLEYKARRLNDDDRHRECLRCKKEMAGFKIRKHIVWWDV